MCLCSFRLRKKGRKIFQKLKKCVGSLPNPKGDSAPAREPAALSELSSLTAGLTEEAVEEAESRDTVETEKGSTGSPLEPSVLGVGVLSSAATFCCGGQEGTNKPGGCDAETSCTKSDTAGTAVKQSRSGTAFIFHIFHPSSSLFASRSRDVIRVQSGRCDVCSAAGSAVCREEDDPGRSSAGGHQGFAQTGCVARPVAREVRCQATHNVPSYILWNISQLSCVILPFLNYNLVTMLDQSLINAG